MKLFRGYCLLLFFLAISWQTLPAQGPTPGQNVNMVSGTTWPYGDPFLERQDEPSLAVSTRNPLHLLAGANDYRTVDLNLPEAEVGEGTVAGAPTGEPWIGEYISTDGGARWQSTLLPGYPQDKSPEGMASPLHGFTTAADPVIVAGTNGMFYYGGIAFNRGTSYGVMFVSRFMDLHNRENGDISKDTFPIRYINTVPVAFGSNMPAQFLDKPAIAADIPRGNSMCSLDVPQGGSTVSQTIPAGNVYVAYANVSSNSSGQTSTIYFSRSTNCGASWSTPVAISGGYTLSQGATIQVDPETGIVYVAWRVIHSAQQPNDGIAIAASIDGGRNFFPPITLVSLPPFNIANPTAPAFFDQNTSYFSFRTTAYPAMAVADSGISFVPGPLYLAWSQRGVPPSGDTKIMMLAIPGNASFTSSGFQPPTPFPVDNGPITNDAGGIFNLSSGFQLMPAMTFNQGKLNVLYYDLRQDHTLGEFTPSVSNGVFTPDANGNFFEENRDLVAEAYAPYFISDAGLTIRRRTIDVVLAQANASFSVPTFAYARVSRYDIGLFTGESGGESAPFHQLKYNPPNLPMFMQGNGAFMGDYLGIAGQPFVLVKCGRSTCWTYNNPSPPGIAGSPFAAPKPALASAVHYASWTSNQDVFPPPNNQWDQYTAIGTGTSVYDGQTQLSCTPGFEGDRNQNVYSSRITQGLLISSPQSSKPLSSAIERGFVILVQNHTSGKFTSSGLVNYFRLTIANQPVNGFASFTQLVPPSPVTSQRIKNFSRLTGIDVAIAPHTGIARTVFAVSSDPNASILVNVAEIDRFGGKPILGGLSGFILLNADGTVPTGLVDPNGQTGNNSISGVELYDPNVSAPNVSAPNVSAPNVSAPNVSAPNVSAPNVSAPNVSAPNVSAPNVSAYGVASPNVSAPNVSAPNVSAAPPSDATYGLTNTGNTTASYRVGVVGATTTPLQLLASQIYLTPQTDGNCNLITQQQNITLANVPNVRAVSSTEFLNPNVSAAPVTETTVSVGPGDTVYFTLRGDVSIDRMQEIVSREVNLAVQPHAIASNNTTATTPPVALFITTSGLPDGVVGRPYGFFPPGGVELPPSVQFAASGGKAPYTWSVDSENLPAGLTLNATTGVLSGTPTISNLPGAAVTFQVQDSVGTVATHPLLIRIADPLAVTTNELPTAFTGSSYSVALASFGGIAPLRWSLVFGSLPSGLVLNPDGTITGVTSVTGSFPVTVRVSDAAVPQQQPADGSITLVVQSVGNASGLAFVSQPSGTQGGQIIAPAISVSAHDPQGAVLPGVNVVLSIANSACSGATLSGTATAQTNSDGVATFSNLSIDRGGYGYTLQASASGTASVTSFSFDVGGFCATGNMPGPAEFFAATLLNDGTALTTGGQSTISGTATASAAVYDPSLHTFAAVGPMKVARSRHSATVLPNGKVLIAGGEGAGTFASAEIYDSGTKTFTATGSMASARFFQTATLLSTGKVLITGGAGLNNAAQQTAELYDPGTGTFSPTGNLGVARSQHTATLLQDGRILVAGGLSPNQTAIGSAEIYDPTTGTFSPTGALITPRRGHRATLLSNGKVLLVGGVNDQPSGTQIVLSGEVYDPVANTFAAAGTIDISGSGLILAALDNGTVLVAGPNGNGDIYDPVANAFSRTGSLTAVRVFAAATTLFDGTALVAGGSNSAVLSSAELYFPVPRPVVIGSLTSGEYESRGNR